MTSAWAELTAKFTAAGLPPPPMPEVLRDQLSKQHEWCWSTQPIGSDADRREDPFDLAVRLWSRP
jgi:hypothetical protein